MKAWHEEENVDRTSAAPWPQLDGVRPRTSPTLDDRRSENGEGWGGAKSNINSVNYSLYFVTSAGLLAYYCSFNM